MQGDTSIRVLVADDQRLVREGWIALLDHSSGISIVGQARDGQEAIELALQLQPDVILMDVNMPRLDGLQATQQIVEKQRRIRILMVTQSLDETLVRAALQHGAWGYLSKSDVFAELLPAVHAVHTGQRYFSQTIREQHPHAIAAARPSRPRHYEWQDAAWAALGQNLDRAIAEAWASQERAGLICGEAQTLRAQLRATRAITHELLQRRQFEAVAATQVPH